MKFSVALFFAGLFGALGTGFILLSFGTDYWLLAWETGDTDSPMLDLVEVGGRRISCYTEVCISKGITVIHWNMFNYKITVPFGFLITLRPNFQLIILFVT